MGAEAQENNPRPWKTTKYKLVREEEWQITRQDKKQSGKKSQKDHGNGEPTLSIQASSLNLTGETCQNVADFLHVVEVIGKWPRYSKLYHVFLIPRTVDSGRPISL